MQFWRWNLQTYVPGTVPGTVPLDILAIEPRLQRTVYLVKD